MTSTVENEVLPLPPFTISDLEKAIPKHCFERSLLRSLSYLIVDLIGISILFYVASYISMLPTIMAIPVWCFYWLIQGYTMTGVWVIAHECGHQAFSPWKSVNDGFGLVLHSLLLVPYYSWKFTHGNHHKATNNMHKDQVFVPRTNSSVNHHDKYEDVPIVLFWRLLITSVLGWPAYLSFNVVAQKYKTRANHFEPSSPLFNDKQRFYILVSDLALIVVGLLFAFVVHKIGFLSFVFYYGVPYLWVNFWLVTITYLQHTHYDVPHYRGSEWTFLRGALATVDRNYGILNQWFHHIGDTHVCHHIFSKMPHYHAEEASEYLKPLLGKYYKFDDTPIFEALWQTRRFCKFVDDQGEILHFKNDRNMIPNKRI